MIACATSLRAGFVDPDPGEPPLRNPMEVIFLGTGSSMGTPVIGCECAVCRGADRFNQRSRASILVRDPQTSILIDPGPDLRSQMLREGVNRLDRVLVTHIHADHVNGIDDLRGFNFRQRAVIPCYGNAATMQMLQARFDYCFAAPAADWSRPALSAHVLEQETQWGDLHITPVPVLHGREQIYGYRINNMAYLTDLKQIPEDSFALLQGLDLLILDCLRYQPHHTHIHVDAALLLAERIGARQTCFTHMTHDIDYHTLNPTLPATMYLAYDGLRMTC